MEKFIHDVIVYLLSPQGIMDTLRNIILLITLLYIVRKFYTYYQKPKIKILRIQTTKNQDNKEDIYCHIKLQIDNPASFENTAYVTVRTITNKLISPFFYPKEERHKIIIPANSDVSYVLQVYDSVSAEHLGKYLRLCVTDSKNKTTSKYIKWK
jgi:hypothetical protein